MDRVFGGEEYLALENKRVAVLRYFVLEQSIILEETGDKITTYGLEVEKWMGTSLEKDFVSDVTTEIEKVTNIMDCLRKNKVMPVHLKEVLTDML